MKLTHILTVLLALLPLGAAAQERSVELSVAVKSIDGDVLTGQSLELTQTDFEVGYGSLRLNAEGICKVKIYPGNHHLSIVREGFKPYATDFAVDAAEKSFSIDVTLAEATRSPFALMATQRHDVFSGRNDLDVQWNTEAPAFFDDFESYSPFAITFGDWTGIDADDEIAAPLVGSYPNRGVKQYAQIINPLTATPTWWYDYPILRPYSGQQYVGFTRTSSGNPNDDWLISPVITPGQENVLSFFAKAADQYNERFMVYATTVVDNPRPEDFVRLDKGNYESADYRGWKNYVYALDGYAGQAMRFAIRYVSDAGRYGAFMLMLDDVYVGQRKGSSLAARVAASPHNPYEQFKIYLDGTLAATTDSYCTTLTDLPAGKHTVGVQAVYRAAESEIVECEVDLDASSYARLQFDVSADSKLSPEGTVITLLNRTSAESYNLTVAAGKAEIPSLPFGLYTANIAQGAYLEYLADIDLKADTVIAVALTDNIIDPYNIMAVTDDDVITIRWNQQQIFSDSFEDYEDFARISFGEWRTVDDGLPTYPIGLGGASTIVSFPGSGNATNPAAIPPLVFNPWNTVPAMLPSDPAIAAPTGDKTIVFFSAQRARSDKWLISPEIEIGNDFVFDVTAKGYAAFYPEVMEFCVSTSGANPSDFTVLSEANPLTSESWTKYRSSLEAYAGQKVRLAVHYISTDAFLAQVDDFTVGPADGQGETLDYGNVLHYEIYLDGTLVGTTETPEYTFTALEGSHTVGICAVYQNGSSQIVNYEFSAQAAVEITGVENVAMPGFDILGRPAAKGLIISNGRKYIAR